MTSTVEAPPAIETLEKKFARHARDLSAIQEHIIGIFGLINGIDYRTKENSEPLSITVENPRKPGERINFTAFIFPEKQGFYQNTGEVQQVALDKMGMGNRYVLSVADESSYTTYHFDSEGKYAAFKGVPGNPPHEIRMTEKDIEQAEGALILARNSRRG